MLDLGCHAAHGPYVNVSDALLWLDVFSESGGLVVGVDAWEDFSLDLQRRFDRVPPYATMRVEKRTYTVAIGARDGGHLDFRHSAHTHATCCAGHWCDFGEHDRRGADHLCRMARMRLGMIPAEPWLSRYPLNISTDGLRVLSSNGSLWYEGRASLRVDVPRVRADTLWRRHLGGRHLHFVKADVDMSWRAMGLEGLVESRGFSVMVVEVDGSWGGVRAGWNVSEVDQLAWYANQHDFDAYLKVPCRARPGAASLEMGGYRWNWTRRKYQVVPHGHHAAWLWPLSRRGQPFAPSRYHAKRRNGVQDVVLVDARAAELAGLPARTAEDCEPASGAGRERPKGRPEGPRGRTTREADARSAQTNGRRRERSGRSDSEPRDKRRQLKLLPSA